jgi:hypothetical protein
MTREIIRWSKYPDAWKREWRGQVSYSNPSSRKCYYQYGDIWNINQSEILNKFPQYRFNETARVVVAQWEPNFDGIVIGWSSSKIVSGSRALPPRWPPQCSCVVIETALIQVSDYRLLGAPGSSFQTFTSQLPWEDTHLLIPAPFTLLYASPPC